MKFQYRVDFFSTDGERLVAVNFCTALHSFTLEDARKEARDAVESAILKRDFIGVFNSKQLLELPKDREVWRIRTNCISRYCLVPAFIEDDEDDITLFPD